jgi:hypothetical protein
MLIKNMTDDVAYRRQLAERVLRSACAAHRIEVADVAWSERDGATGYAVLCFVVDPNADDHIALNTDSSAAEQLQQTDPNGILREAGSWVDVDVQTIELADQASLVMADDELISPWMHDHAVARLKFSYRPRA